MVVLLVSGIRRENQDERMNHDELEGLVPLLALDALGPPEEAEVRAHVAGCESCAVLLREHLETAAGLALLAEPATPPAHLKARLMADIAQEPEGAASPPSPAPVAAPASTPAPAPGSTPGSGRGDEVGARREAHATRRAGRPDRSDRSWWQRYGAVVAVAACLVLGFAWYAYDSVTENAARLDVVAARQEQIRELVGGRQPSLTLIPTGNGPASGGLVFARGGRAAVVLEGLDASAEGVYEVWAIRGGKPVPLAPVGEDAWQGTSGRAIVLLEEGVEGVEGMAVSIEPSEPPADAEGPKGPIVLSS